MAGAWGLLRAHSLILDLATDSRRPHHVQVDGRGVGRTGIAVLLAGVAVAGCGGGHSHAATPAATGVAAASGAQVLPGGGGPSLRPVINGPASTGQAVAGQGGAGSVGGGGTTTAGAGSGGSAGVAGAAGAQGSSQVIGFPVGPLLPTTVDAGQCQAARLADKSVYAQIAVVRATCAQVPTVAAGADRARGASYSAAGFACAAIAQEPSNSYWLSAYTTYSCRSGNDQIAFNWGTSSSRF